MIDLHLVYFSSDNRALGRTAHILKDFSVISENAREMILHSNRTQISNTGKGSVTINMKATRHRPDRWPDSEFPQGIENAKNHPVFVELKVITSLEEILREILPFAYLYRASESLYFLALKDEYN